MKDHRWCGCSVMQLNTTLCLTMPGVYCVKRRKNHVAPIPLTSLTDRELEVLELVAQGATNQDIADTLVISLGTVKSHINHIMGKLDAQNRTEAVKGTELGILDAYIIPPLPQI